MKKEKVLLIMAQTGFLYKGSTEEGYTVCHPYNPCTLLGRIFREFVFRLVPPLSKIFFNQKVFEGQWEHILIWDPLVTKKFLQAVHKAHPDAKIHFIYWNMVGKASHLMPDKIPAYVERWTYDSYDSEHYELKLYTSYPYYRCFITPHVDNQIDVLFVGRDKGRGQFLLDLENKLKAQGLATRFIITKSGRLSRRKKYYQSEVSYDELCKMISHSRSVLNVIMENQKGLTLRDLEYVFQGVKLITTNQAIVSDPIYHPNNVFVIKEDNIAELRNFLALPIEPLSPAVIEHHTFDSFVREITRKDIYE